MRAQQTLFTDALAMQVTADNTLLVGLGNQAYLHTSRARLQLPQETRHRKIQGFAVGPISEDKQQQLLLYADNEYSLFNYAGEGADQPFKLLYEGETKDWINAATFLKDEFVLHMAHSMLLRLQYVESEGCKILELARCTDYSMLYHTHLSGHSYDELVVMSGNGFGELLIWQPRHPVDDKGQTYPLLARLEAHNGVIFSIDYHAASQLLITTSDDRSVKFWQVKREDEEKDWKLQPLFSCFGHGARVMCAIIIEQGTETFVASGGEDSYICIWNRSGELLLKRRQQFGAPIWRLAYDASTGTLFSGGATGNVLPYNLQELLSQEKRQQSQLSTLPSLPAASEFIGKVKFLNHSNIVGLSSANRLFHLQLDEQLSSTWQLVDCFPAYKCSVLAVENYMVAICGYRRLTLLHFDVDSGQFELLYDGAQLKGVIRAFHFLAEQLYLISDDLGNCALLEGSEMRTSSLLQLPPCREPWLTAALLINPDCLLLSSRQGHVMLYAREDCSANFKLRHTLKRLHGHMGATLFQLASPASSNEAFVWSAGHEPALRLLHLSWPDYSLSYCRRENVPLSWVEASPTQDLLVGFNDNHIVAWSRRHDVLAQLQCGGGHRAWDYHLNEEQELLLIYVKLQCVYLHRQPLLQRQQSLPSLSPPNRWHTRSCNILRLLKWQRSVYLISAGDDNLIKISAFDGDGNLRQLAELQTHISSVRHLTLHKEAESDSSSSSWLIFSVGGRAQLCINRLRLSEASPTDCQLQELATHTVAGNEEGEAVLEARLMAIEVLPQDDPPNVFSLFLASADGKIRLHRWSLEQPSELPFLRLIELQRCPLQLRCLAWSQPLLLVATSNGELLIYDRSLETLLLRLELHDAGINALDASIEDQQLHLLSGGDDEQVRHTVIDLKSMKVERSNAYDGLHDAQVNALTLQRRGADGKGDLWAFTCAIDKQVRRLNLSKQLTSSAGHTCIADIKGMQLDGEGRVYFYGCGLQIMPLKELKSDPTIE